MKLAYINKKPNQLDARVHLPSSKSISNRALIVRHLCGVHFEIKNLSSSADTVLLERLLKNIDQDELNAEDAGTTFRFLTALLAIRPGERILTGTERMSRRPVKALADAINSLGGHIEYIEKEGFPPLKISGKPLKGGEVEVDASVSSQFISALLMIAPVLEKGIVIHFINQPVSQPYIDMTLHVMGYFGVQHEWLNRNKLKVGTQSYVPRDISIEADWSSASYWYGLVALSPNGKASLYGLNKKSPQGDRMLSAYMANFGIKTRFYDGRVDIQNRNQIKPYFVRNMLQCPDLIPTLAVLCACFNISSHIKGSRTLKNKESDRTTALKREFLKLGYHINIGDNHLLGIPSQLPVRSPVILDSHGDHRLAMAFAMLSYLNPGIYIRNPEVVSKSYPNFWEQLKDNGVHVRFTSESQLKVN